MSTSSNTISRRQFFESFKMTLKKDDLHRVIEPDVFWPIGRLADFPPNRNLYFSWLKNKETYCLVSKNWGIYLVKDSEFNFDFSKQTRWAVSQLPNGQIAVLPEKNWSLQSYLCLLSGDVKIYQHDN